MDLRARLRRLMRVDGLPLAEKQAEGLAKALAQRGSLPQVRATYLAALRGLGLPFARSAATALADERRPYLLALRRAGINLDAILGEHELWTAVALRALQRTWARDRAPAWSPAVEEGLLCAAVEAVGTQALAVQATFSTLPKAELRTHLRPLLPPGADLAPLRSAYLRALGPGAARSSVAAVERLLAGEDPASAAEARWAAEDVDVNLLRAALALRDLEAEAPPDPVPVDPDRLAAPGPEELDPDQARLLDALREGVVGAVPCFPLADALISLLARTLGCRTAPTEGPRTDPGLPDGTAAPPCFALTDRAQAWAAVGEDGPMDLRGWLALAARWSTEDNVLQAALDEWHRAECDRSAAWEGVAAALARHHLGVQLRWLRERHPGPQVAPGQALAGLQAAWLAGPLPWHPLPRRRRLSQRFHLDPSRPGTDRRLAAAMWRHLGTPSAQLAWLLREWTAAERALQHLGGGLPGALTREVVPLVHPLLAPQQALSGYTSAVSRIGAAAWGLVALDEARRGP
jgi:hypothetical protein